MEMNVGYLLTNAASHFPNKTALAFEGKEVPYWEFNDRVNRLAHFLLGMGVEKGARVSTLMNNCSAQLEIYLACAKIGAIFAPFNCRLKERELEYLIRNSGAHILFFSKDYAKEVTYLNSLSQLTTSLCVDSPDAESSDYAKALKGSSGTEPDVVVHQSDACQLLYTSGTTGKPKGVILSHKNIVWNAMNSVMARGDHSEERFLLVGPLYHAAGLNSHFTSKLAIGASVVIMKNFDARRMLSLIEQYRVTTVSAAPSLFHILFQFQEINSYDLSSVTSCSVGSAICPENIKKDIFRHFPKVTGIMDVYGQTEATCNISVLAAKDWERKKGSVGKAVPFSQVRIVDDQDRDLPAGEIGELICRGPNVMEGYYNNPEAAQSALRGGWLHTGDLARKDEEGYIYIAGRIKDMVITGGENVYPREVEDLLLEHPNVKEAVIIGVPDPKWGEAVKAVIVIHDGKQASEEEIIHFCKQSIAHYKAPKSVNFVNELPRNASGKIDKENLKRSFGVGSSL